VNAGGLFGIDSHSAEGEGSGNCTYTRGLIAGLFAASGGDDFVLFSADPGHPFYRALPRRSRSGPLRVTQGRRGLSRLGWALGRAARSAGVDALHVQYSAPLGYGGPLVVTVHDLGFLHVPESFPPGMRVALRVLVRRSVARASRIVTDSEFSARDIAARLAVPAERIAVIPLAADARFRPLPGEEAAQVLARHGIEPGFVFSLGRLNRRKNLARLLAAYGRLGGPGGAPPPLVVGGKRDHGVEDVLREAKLSDAGPRVRFTEFIPDDDLPAFYSAAACFVYPSLFEGFGLPVLEAMACGTPVVAASRAALPELVGDAGILVDPESVDELAAGLGRVLGDRALAADLGARGRERSRRYSWTETARRTLDVYRAAIAR
jgi:glycosyltransferase involved in cell wall biosynthesis